ncbi:hypothetical protein MLOOGBEN_21790 [Bacillus sp. EB106-08-02-XG196]|nr:hypothetical protein [Bacillus sp. EB106-08-02-XG196]
MSTLVSELKRIYLWWLHESIGDKWTLSIDFVNLKAKWLGGNLQAIFGVFPYF